MIKIGLMGCGTVANYGHAPVLAESNDFDFVAVYDPDIARARALSTKFGVPVATANTDEFFGTGIDAVTVTSPAPAHLENVRAATRARLPILCEKPLALTESDIEEMIRITDAASVPLYAGFDYRFSPVSLRIRDLIRDGAIGEPRILRLVYIWTCHGKWQIDDSGRLVENARRAGRMHEGGPMVDCGVHQIDLARFWLASEVTRWKSVGAWADAYAAPDHVWLHMEHENAARTMVEMSYSYGHTAKDRPSRFTYEIIGTNGVILYDREAKSFEVRTPSGTERLPFASEKNFAGMYAAFAEALRTGSSGDLATARDGLAATRLAREATEAVMKE